MTAPKATTGRHHDPVALDAEARWIAAACQGDSQAYERLYRLHVDRIHGLCLRLVGGNRPLAEELTQQAFVRAWRKLPSFRGEARFSTWMHRLTVNLVLSDRRSANRRRQRERPAEEAAGYDWISDRDVRVALTRDLERAIADLPDGARAVLVLHDIEGYRHAEIAERMGIAEGTSKAQLHRARKLLRAALTA